MKSLAKDIDTSIDKLSFSLNPRFKDKLEKCETKEDLFRLVEENGFVCPDALREVEIRGWYKEYRAWRNR